tara:strand:+ start:621 stop:1046 length:426 start_codon:yes stop_codon:yes gene_type:complete
MDPFKIFLNKIKLREEKGPKHFSPKEEPGQADDTFHDCISKVKAEARKEGKSMSEKEAAAICEKSREEGGATLKFGAKRKAEEDKKREKKEKRKVDEEVKMREISREEYQKMLRRIGTSQSALKKKVKDQIKAQKPKEETN